MKIKGHILQTNERACIKQIEGDQKDCTNTHTPQGRGALSDRVWTHSSRHTWRKVSVAGGGASDDKQVFRVLSHIMIHPPISHTGAARDHHKAPAA